MLTTATGVPKFFRWMSERYPAISQLIAENRIPEFDCLYVCVLEYQLASNLTLDVARHEWYHPQLHAQRFGFGYETNDRRSNVHRHLQLH